MNELIWIRLSFVDVFGTVNSVLLPADRFDEAATRGVIFDGSALDGRSRLFESDMRLQPVPETLIDLGDGLGRVVCRVIGPDGAPWAGDPRTCLTNVVDDLGDLAASTTFSGELEFYVVGPDGEPVDGGGYFDEGNGPGTDVLQLAGRLLGERGVPILSGHHETGPGQYEIDLAPGAPMEFADRVVLATQTVREAAAAFGVRATFMPLPFGGLPGSGLHVHQRSELLQDPTGELTPDGRSFVAGQLAHARALCAFTSPTINSYRRLHAGPEAPSAAIWGHASRAALVRVSRHPQPDGSIEFRGSDPSANPYLLIAGLLVAGALGIDDGLELAPPNDESAGGFEPALEQRFAPLPRNLDEAIDALFADDQVVDAFDPTILERLGDGRRAESDDFRAHVTEWEQERDGGWS